MAEASGHHVVVVGGGFGGLQAALTLRWGPVDATLVDRRNFHLFQPLTYQVATGALTPGEVAYPLRAPQTSHRDRSLIPNRLGAVGRRGREEQASKAGVVQSTSTTEVAA